MLHSLCIVYAFSLCISLCIVYAFSLCISLCLLHTGQLLSDFNDMSRHIINHIIWYIYSLKGNSSESKVFKLKISEPLYLFIWLFPFSRWSHVKANIFQIHFLNEEKHSHGTKWNRIEKNEEKKRTINKANQLKFDD